MRTSSSIRSILLTTALGEPSRKAAPIACMLARSHGARIHVLHVVPTSRAVVGTLLGVADVVDCTLADARRRLKAFIQQELAWRCASVTGEVRLGTPVYEQIVSYAREHDIDLIVTGTHGDGMLHRVVFGSVTKAVLEHAPCPVLLVPCAKARQPVEAELELVPA